MFTENNLTLSTPETSHIKALKPEEIGELTIDEVFEKLSITQPKTEDITDMRSYMKAQSEVMTKLIEAFHDENIALAVYQKNLAQEFQDKYRHGF